MHNEKGKACVAENDKYLMVMNAEADHSGRAV
jgi:hypothetical protein